MPVMLSISIVSYIFHSRQAPKFFLPFGFWVKINKHDWHIPSFSQLFLIDYTSQWVVPTRIERFQLRHGNPAALHSNNARFPLFRMQLRKPSLFFRPFHIQPNWMFAYDQQLGKTNTLPKVRYGGSSHPVICTSNHASPYSERSVIVAGGGSSC